MKARLGLVLIAAALLTCGSNGLAQNTNDAAQTLDNLRAQLSDLQDKEAELKIRLQQLDFDLRPENIERYFSGYGSVHPEELRENRRRQLQTEKDRILAQLDQLAAGRARLETAIVNEQARAYQQSALGTASLKPDPKPGTHLLTAARMLVAGSVLILVVGSLVLRLAIRRRLHV